MLRLVLLEPRCPLRGAACVSYLKFMFERSVFWDAGLRSFHPDAPVAVTAFWCWLLPQTKGLNHTHP